MVASRNAVQTISDYNRATEFSYELRESLVSFENRLRLLLGIYPRAADTYEPILPAF